MKIPWRNPASLAWLATYLVAAFLLAGGFTHGWPWPIQFALVYASILGLGFSSELVRNFNERKAV